MTRVAALVVAAVLLGHLSPAARADSREGTALGKAQQATAAYNLGRFEAAAQLWEDAYLLVQDPNFLFNIGQSQRQAGRLDAAMTAYRSYLRTTAPEAANRTQAEKRLAEIERQLAERRTNATRPLGEPTEPTNPSPPPLRAVTVPTVATAKPAEAAPAWPIWVGIGAVVVAGIVVGFAITRDPTSVPNTPLGSRKVF